MPEPQGKFSSDIYIYRLTNGISPYLCHISPNVISIVGFLFVIPILYNLVGGRGIRELLVLVFLRQFLDCLDGSVARKCNTGSIFGAKLDVLLDTLFSILTGFFFIQRLLYSPKTKVNIYIKIILIIITLYAIYCCASLLYKKRRAEQKGEDMDSIKLEETTFSHDNSVLLSLIGFFIMKKLV